MAQLQPKAKSWRGREMAIDTVSKRFSMLNFGDGTTIYLLFAPDGAIDLDDRQQLLDCYNGIAFGAPAGPSQQALIAAIRIRPSAGGQPDVKPAVTGTPRIRP